MTTKTYSTRGNASAAARKALGKTAKAGVEFDLHGADGRFTWTAKEGAKKKRTKGRLQDQPQMQKLLKLMQREKGVSVKDAAEALGNVEEHTVRGSVSRLRKVVKGITIGREFRKVTYHLPKDAVI